MTCFVRKVSATCCVKKKKNFLMEQVTLHFLLDASRRGVLDGIKVKRSLMRQINSVTLCVEIVFFHARNHAFFSSTKQVTFHAYVTKKAVKMASTQRTTKTVNRSLSRKLFYFSILYLIILNRSGFGRVEC